MAKQRKLHPAIEAALAAQGQQVDTTSEALEVVAEEAGDVDGEEQAADEVRSNSVVKSGYKVAYRMKADAMTRRPKAVPIKALRRMSGDWLAIELAKVTLDPKAKLIVSQFEAVLAANGVDHAKWNRTTKGWQGRLRMTGRLALERIVAAEGSLALPNGAAVPAPRAWVAAHQR